MRKCDNYFAVSCYRYAPERFTACYVKEFSNGNKNIPCYTEINLTNEEKSACGNAFCTKGRLAAIAELKHIIRKRERKDKIYITYGSAHKNNSKLYSYTNTLLVPENNLTERLYAYKEWKKYCIANDWKLSNYKVEEIQFDPNDLSKKPTEKMLYDELVKDKFIKIYTKSKTLYKND